MKTLVTFSVIFTAVTANSIPHFGFPEENINRGRIINGQIAEPYEAPYIVSLKWGPFGPHICGGSIITAEWIITAAHCLIGCPYVVAGLYNRNDEQNTQRINVIKSIPHEKYYGGVGPYDIALLKLEKLLEFNDYIQPVNLPKTSTQQTGIGKLYGWGRDNASSYSLPLLLQTVTTNLLTFEECKKLLPVNSPIHETNICSDSKNLGISACSGDSGGPLVQVVDGKIILVGIVSWGYIPCGQANYPSVNTHTGAHLDWIQKQMANN